MYGGAVAFSYGPLHAQGRISVGVYVMKSQAYTRIEGHFYAGGSARIAFFGIAASFTVNLGQDSQGNMVGDATFRYSFSVGFAKFRFAVTVWREEGKGFENSSASLDPGGRLRNYAMLEGAVITDDVRRGWPKLTNRGVCMGVDWREHHNYFDDALKPAGRGA